LAHGAAGRPFPDQTPGRLPGARPLSAPVVTTSRGPENHAGAAARSYRLLSTCAWSRVGGRRSSAGRAPSSRTTTTVGASERPGEGEPQVAQPARADLLGCVTIGSPCPTN